MPYAIIEDSGTQIKVTTGDVLEVDLRTAKTGRKDSVGDSGTGEKTAGATGMEPGSTLTFDRVLLVGGGDSPARIGTPYLAGASVTAEVITPFLDDKVMIKKYARRKGYRRTQGHRQAYLRIKIGAISI